MRTKQKLLNLRETIIFVNFFNYKMNYYFIIISIILIFLFLPLGFMVSLREDFLNRFKRKKISFKRIMKRDTVKIKLPQIEKTSEIPKKIFQTHESIDLLPDYYIKNLKDLNKGWEYIFHDKDERKKFLLENYGKNYVDKLDSFERGAHKADLWRLCVLYKYGGCYLDADVSMFVPFNEIIKNCSEKLIIPNTVVGLQGKRLFNAMIICKPGDEIIGECIKRIMLIDNKKLKNNYHYIIYLMEEITKKKIKHEILEIYKPNSYFYFSSKPENHYMYLKGEKIGKSKREDFL